MRTHCSFRTRDYSETTRVFEGSAMHAGRFYGPSKRYASPGVVLKAKRVGTLSTGRGSIRLTWMRSETRRRVARM